MDLWVLKQTNQVSPTSGFQALTVAYDLAFSINEVLHMIKQQYYVALSFPSLLIEDAS